MGDQPPPQSTNGKSPEVEELTAKVNSLLSELANEKSLRIRTEKIAKINSLHADFKAETNMSPDYLEGVAYGIEFERKHPKSNSAAKENALPNVPTAGTPKNYNTPDGKQPDGSKPLAKRVGFEQPDGASF